MARDTLELASPNCVGSLDSPLHERRLRRTITRNHVVRLARASVRHIRLCVDQTHRPDIVERVRSESKFGFVFCSGSRLSSPVVSTRNAKALWQRAICCTLLVVLIAGFVGFPLAQITPPKEGRFPCENCPCGCANATFCWDTCCCFSDSEKLDWAAKNGVTPPEFLVARAAGSTHADSVANASQLAKTSCCGCSGGLAESNPARCDLVTEVRGPAESESAANTTNGDAQQNGVRLIRLVSVAKCRGIDLVWSLFSNAVLGLPSATTTKPDSPFLFVWPLANEWADSFDPSVDPPVP